MEAMWVENHHGDGDGGSDVDSDVDGDGDGDGNVDGDDDGDRDASEPVEVCLIVGLGEEVVGLRRRGM